MILIMAVFRTNLILIVKEGGRKWKALSQIKQIAEIPGEFSE
jgi:hypothetical protein